MGILYLVATPIGNLEDITIRAIKTLFSVDYIACEDTRRTGMLIQNLELRIKNQEFGIRNLEIHRPQFISYYDEIENRKSLAVINLLENGKNVALVSDGGTPLISDPGFKLVKECIKRSIKVISIPGPTSLVTALTSSGLSTDQFLFLGYLPSSQTKRLKLLSDLQGTALKRIHPTIIFFETPHRIKESLKDLEEVFGDIEIVIARELTKIYEEVWKGKISETITQDFKGELVILFNIPQA